MSNPSEVTTPTVVQKSATKLLVGNGGNVPGALLFSHPHGSVVKPKTIPHAYTDITSAENTDENLEADRNNKWQF